MGGPGRVNRGEIWIADLPPPDKRRPVVLVSRDTAYEAREIFTVAPVTTRLRQIGSHVAVGVDDGLTQRSAINCDRLQTVHRSLLKRYIASLTEARVAELDDALRYSLGLD
jgi:mRNA interferase MazF